MINEKVISLLKSSLAFEFAEFELDFDKKNLDLIVPKPEAIGIVNEVTPLNCFLFFNKEVEKEENSKILFKIKFKYNK